MAGSETDDARQARHEGFPLRGGHRRGKSEGVGEVGEALTGIRARPAQERRSESQGGSEEGSHQEGHREEEVIPCKGQVDSGKGQALLGDERCSTSGPVFTYPLSLTPYPGGWGRGTQPFKRGW